MPSKRAAKLPSFLDKIILKRVPPFVLRLSRSFLLFERRLRTRTMFASSSSSSRCCCFVSAVLQKQESKTRHKKCNGGVFFAGERTRVVSQKVNARFVVKAGSSFEQKFGKDGSGAFSGGVGGGMAGQSQGEVSAQDLAILQQRLGGQQISFEGAGAQQLQQKRFNRPAQGT